MDAFTAGRVPYWCSTTAAYVRALTGLITPSQLATEEECVALLLTLLPSVHHPHIAAFQPDLLLTVSRRLFDVRKLFAHHAEAVLDILSTTLQECYGRETDEEKDRVAAMRHMVRTMTRVRGFEDMRGTLVRQLLSVLGQPQLLSTTTDEVGIFNTPEGELYDTSFLPKAKQEPTKNQKGYEDLKWEMEVRKELAKKKGKQVQAAPKLTKHHIELKNKTLKAEAEVRARMSALDQQVFAVFVIMEGLLNGSVDAIGPSVPTLTTSLLRVVRMSALAGPRAAEAFVKLSAVLHRFVREDEASGLGCATVCMAGSKAPLPPSVVQEDPIALTVRLMRDLLHVAHGMHSKRE